MTARLVHSSEPRHIRAGQPFDESMYSSPEPVDVSVPAELQQEDRPVNARGLGTVLRIYLGIVALIAVGVWWWK